MAVVKVRLLTSKERSVCQNVVLLRKGLGSTRAAALLALDDGMIQPEAAKESGLTIGQLRYAVTLFKKKKLAIFSAELLALAISAPEEERPIAVQQKTIQSNEEKPAKAKKVKDKAKKGKKRSKKDKAVKKEKGKNKKSSAKKSAKKSKKNKKNKK